MFITISERRENDSVSIKDILKLIDEAIKHEKVSSMVLGNRKKAKDGKSVLDIGDFR